jgi:3-oxoacyl-[acyl-carrier protein] reductase/pteridine reductase
MELRDKVVVITGAAQRVGRVIALELARRGAHIAFSWHFENEPYAETRAEIEALGRQTYVERVDVTQGAQIRSFIANTAQQLGRVDVLINNAGVWLNSPALDISEADWDLAMAVNVRGPFLASQAVIPHMQRQGAGVIINITDLSAFQVWPNYTHHAASKAALVAVTKSLAVEFAPTVRVNAIAPGTVLLPPDPTPSKIAWAEGKSLLKRVGAPEDVARTAAFLIEMDFATGGVYFMDGGRALV